MEGKKIKYTNHKVKLDYVVKLSMSGSKSKITTVFTITLIHFQGKKIQQKTK